MYSSFNARAVGLPNLPVTTTIEVAAQAGFAAVDLMIRDLVVAGADLDQVRVQMNDHGLRAGAFPMTMNWRGDEATFRRDLADLPRYAEAAATLGFARTGTWVMPRTPTMPLPHDHPGLFRADVANLHLERIGAMARILARFQIQIGLEVIGVATFQQEVGVPFITRVSQLAATLGDLFAEPNVGLLVDAFHMFAADEPFEAGLTWGARRLVWAHIADLPTPGPVDKLRIVDAYRGLPSPEGAVDCRRFLQLLAKSGYDGPVTAEPLAQCQAILGREPIEVARRVKQACDLCWPTCL